MMAEHFDPGRDQAEQERRAERRRLKQIARLLELSRPQPSPDFRANLGQRLGVESLEPTRLLPTERLLEGARPQPRPSFRNRLGTELSERGAATHVPRPIAAYTLSGLALLALAAAGVAGLGPLAPG
jgi:hypothetical protein